MLQQKLPILITLVLSILLVFISDDVKDLVQRHILPTPTPTDASPSASPTPGHDGVFATVVAIVDGDTIKVEGGEIVRYIGMDTPETVDPRRPVECFGAEASAKNKELVQGKVVELEKDISERDTYGRLLRYVWMGDIFINEQLVREGFAYVSTFPPDVKYEERLLEAQRLARDEKKGLWSGACPLPSAPRRPQSTESAAPPQLRYEMESFDIDRLGIIRSDGCT